MSWFSSRNWCSRKGGHLLNKSNIDYYVPPYSVTSHTYYWIGLRKSDWIDVEKKGHSRSQKAMRSWNWRETGEIEGNECSMISRSKLQSKPCESEETFVCVGKC